MGAKLIAKGTDAEAYATEYSAPIRRALEGVFFTNTTPEKCAHNYAPGKPNGKVVGLIAPTANYMPTKPLINYIETEIVETETMTFFVVAKTHADGSDLANRPFMYGNYLATAGAGTGLYVQSVNQPATFAVFGLDSETDNVRSVGVASQPVISWNLYVCVIRPMGLTITNATTGATNTLVETRPRMVNSLTAKMRIGSAITSYTAESDIGLIQHHSAELSDTEITTTVADLRAYMGRKGIAV